jgi:hypothetical protein
MWTYLPASYLRTGWIFEPYGFLDEWRLRHLD